MTATATMTSTVYRPSRPPMAPPSKPLPSLPIPKTRLPNIPDAPEDRPYTPSSALPTPSKQRSVTASALPTPKSGKTQSASSVPTLSTTFASPPKSPGSSQTPRTSLPGLRKVSSIGAFPLPPKSTPRISSLPPSPLSTSESYSDLQSAAQSSNKKQKTEPRSRTTEGAPRRQKTTRSSGYGLRARASAGAASAQPVAPSLLNGSGENSFISSAEGARGSDGFLSLPSPPQSRDSSVDESYNTDDTIFEDLEVETPGVRGRKKSMDSKRSSAGTAKDNNKGNVIVSVRVRPDSGGGDSHPEDGEWMVDSRRSLISYRGKEGGDHIYDNVFSPHDGNARVYDNAAKRLVRRVMEGYNGTVFAYGMTGTGKTFSMQGTANQPGTIPLAITDIFSYIRENPDREFLLRVSYLEIYNEKIFDLLNASTPGTQQEEIKLREDSKRGVYASPLKEEIVQSPNQLLRVISRGDQARRTGSTQFNARSSRSHAVVQIVVESRERISGPAASDPRRSDRILPGGVLVSTLSLIDLAGSEKAAANKERRTEGGHINKSLLTLGTVIARLTGDEDKEDGAKPTDKEKSLKHLPYRDSKLTRLLQPALSGDSLVSILCTIQLSSASTSAASTGAHTGETLNTLKFASRAKNNIVSHAKKNESNTSGDPNSRALLDRYRAEIQELRAQLEAQTKAKAEAEERDEIEQDRRKEAELERQERTRHEEQMLEMQLARTALKERIGHLNRLILSSKSLGVNSGRYSSASMPMHRMSTMSHASGPEFGRPVSLRSRDSLNSRRESESYRNSPRTSTHTLEVPNTEEHTLQRKVSSGSITMGVFPAAQPSQLAEESEDEDDSAGPRGDGEASLIKQNSMLQADLSDKNRYIATLEKRLIQARRSSQSRTSMSFSYPNRVSSGQAEFHDIDSLVREKDKEIDELRAKLDDQIRMVQALRSAARKRETLETGQKNVSTVHASTQTANLSPRKPTLAIGNAGSDNDDVFSPLVSRATSRHTHQRRSLSINSHNSSNSHRRPSNTLSPVALLSPSRSHDSALPRDLEHSKATAAAAKLQGATRRRSVDEMTALLDQMIADKVESGHMVRGERGSLRVKRDTVMEKLSMEKLSLSPPINVESPVDPGAQRMA